MQAIRRGCSRPIQSQRRFYAQNPYVSKSCQPLSALKEPKNIDGTRLQKELTDHLPGWTIVNDSKAGLRIKRDFVPGNFVNCYKFLGTLVDMAEAEGHHPDIAITSYKNMSVEYWSHEVGGITENDLICAAKTNALWDGHKQ